jgi:hypothetical protein
MIEFSNHVLIMHGIFFFILKYFNALFFTIWVSVWFFWFPFEIVRSVKKYRINYYINLFNWIISYNSFLINKSNWELNHICQEAFIHNFHFLFIKSKRLHMKSHLIFEISLRNKYMIIHFTIKFNSKQIWSRR